MASSEVSGVAPVGARPATGRGLSGIRRAIADFFAFDDDWERPRPPIGRSDIIFAACVEAGGILMLELARSVGGMQSLTQPVWVQWLTVTLGAALLIGRRRWPLTVALLLAIHMFVTGVTMPMVMAQLTLQFCYFMGLFSGVAFGRSRQAAVTVAGVIIAFMLLWLAYQFALGSGVQDFIDSSPEGRIERHGWFDPIPAAVILTFSVNVLYFFGAAIGGQVSWRSARQRARLAEQTLTIEAQSESLRRRAVVDERLRIARELHDVVGHHVSVIGIQAAGARRVLDRDPDQAKVALAAIEQSSREAVTQMRGLLGTLRDIEDERRDTAPSDGMERAPEPGVADLPALAEERSRAGVETTYSLVEDEPGAAAALPPPVSLSLYRVAQEALANIARHSTARTARLVLRLTSAPPQPYAELEIVDDGRPRAGTSGSGLGQLGMRERVASHRGEVEIGPRATGGYRVRLRIPLPHSGAREEDTAGRVT